MIMKKEYQIRLYQNNDYIILNTYSTQEQANYMLQWYQAHKKFFNGNFEVVINLNLYK